jgi:hypothetical protein
VNVFNNRELEKMFGSERLELPGGWRKLRNEEHYEFLSPLDSIGVTIKKIMARAGHGARE